MVANKPRATTVGELVEYLAHMQRIGKAQGTVFSYSIELRTAAAELGADIPLAQLTPDRVQAYYDSDRVTKTRDGRAKSKAGVAKTTTSADVTSSEANPNW